MTDADFARIETELQIKLPAEYRREMATAAPALIQLLVGYQGHFDEYEALFLTGEFVIAANQRERDADSGTSYAFPEWQRTFVMIGTDTAGGYYSLRLDEEPGVWMIGSDCGSEATQVHDSLADCVQEMRQTYEDLMGDPDDAVAVPCLTQSEWEKLRPRAADSGALGTSFSRWEELQSDAYRERRLQRKEPRRIWINADQFLAWCESEGREADAAARYDYAEARLEVQEPWLARHRGR